MANIGISNANTSQVDANVCIPGPTGVVGDMKTNPVANPNISQNDVSSTQHISREMTDETRPGTKAFENKQEDLEKSDPEQQRLDSGVLKAVITHNNSSGANLIANPSVSAEYEYGK
ncbi:MAG: hypothetical protein LBB16_01960 [Puniceicoccales bacterium]|jgi:hypothetical protein|nr:hypothetical protein [Puniceicoccales bacterium]